jgi:hypothetical protein
LPVRICNAIRIYRRAAMALRNGRERDARDLLDDADTEFERWQSTSRGGWSC